MPMNLPYQTRHVTPDFLAAATREAVIEIAVGPSERGTKRLKYFYETQEYLVDISSIEVVYKGQSAEDAAEAYNELPRGF